MKQFLSLIALKFIQCQAQKYFVMAMKDNRKVALSLADKQACKYIGIKEAVIEGCVQRVYIEQLEFSLLITNNMSDICGL